MTPDLSALNAAERRVLALLGRGHTAKSAAALVGSTEAAVNERLREARRKTGVGSSRELARLLSAQVLQENRDEEIGVASPTRPPPGGAPEPAPRTAGRREGRIAMLFFMFGAAAVAAPLLVDRGASVAPRVVATSPAQGARVPAGPFALSVTFDRPMRGDGWSFTGDPARYPDCAKAPRLSADARTFTLSCRAEAGRAYAVGFNGGRFRNFRDRDGVPAEPYLLRFSTR